MKITRHEVSNCFPWLVIWPMIILALNARRHQLVDSKALSVSCHTHIFNVSIYTILIYFDSFGSKNFVINSLAANHAKLKMVEFAY